MSTSQPRPAELNRLVANLINKGVVSASDPNGLVRVKVGDNETDWVPYLVLAAGGVNIHRPPSVGEFCVLLAPSGDLANSIVLTGIQSTEHPSPSNSADETAIRFPDGAVAKYNHARSFLEWTGPKVIQFNASEKMIFNTPLTVHSGETVTQGAAQVLGLFSYKAGMSGTGGSGGGQTTITGNFTQVNGKLSSNGIVLDSHLHKDSIGGTTGGPI